MKLHSVEHTVDGLMGSIDLLDLPQVLNHPPCIQTLSCVAQDAANMHCVGATAILWNTLQTRRRLVGTSVVHSMANTCVPEIWPYNFWGTHVEVVARHRMTER